MQIITARKSELLYQRIRFILIKNRYEEEFYVSKFSDETAHLKNYPVRSLNRRIDIVHHYDNYIGHMLSGNA